MDNSKFNSTLFIDIVNYENGIFKDRKRGADADKKILTEIYKKSLFQHAIDLTAKEIIDSIENFFISSNCKSNTVILGTHGDNDGIYGADANPINFQSIYDIFQNFLKNAEKTITFILQTCRGVITQSFRSNEPKFIAKPLMPGLFVVYSCKEGHKSFRDEGGSLLFQAMRYAYRKAFRSTDNVIQFFQDTTLQINQLLGHTNRNQTPEIIGIFPSSISEIIGDENACPSFMPYNKTYECGIKLNADLNNNNNNSPRYSLV